MYQSVDEYRRLIRERFEYHGEQVHDEDSLTAVTGLAEFERSLAEKSVQLVGGVDHGLLVAAPLQREDVGPSQEE